MIPFLQINEFFNPGEMLETYLKFLPKPDDPNANLFPMAKLRSKQFSVLDPAHQVLYENNKKVGKTTISKMMASLCEVTKTEKCTNHQGNFFH